MKTSRNTIIGVMLLIFLGIFVACNPGKQSGNNQPESESNKSGQQKNLFNDLREMAFQVSPDQLEIENFSDQTKVFGIVMDWDLGSGNGIATLVAYKTGDASVYLSSGGGVIGGGQYENVKKAVFPYINLGQESLNKATKTENTLLPDKNSITFYLLTSGGIYYGKENMKNIESKNSDWLKLFEEANKVLAELRLTTQEK